MPILVTALITFIIALTPGSARAAPVPEPGSLGIRTLDAEGQIVGGIDVRIMLLEGNWPQETLYVTTEFPGLVWSSLMEGLYEVVVLDDGGAPVPSTAVNVFIPSGAHDNILILHLPPTCPGDFNGDGLVGFGDLTQLLSNWGACGGCPEDIDGSGDVGFGDLVALLAAWGACAGD